MITKWAYILLILLVTAQPVHAKSSNQECNEMEVWSYSMAMCMPLPMAGMPMKMMMFQGNAFFTQPFQDGPRGRDDFAVPNMFMVDFGQSVGDRHYLNLDLMGTFEKWSLPKEGYPELLQIGEHQENGQPFLDAQHPHSSPIMGLTLSDTISLGNGKNHLKFWFAPRGEATDGPIAFMHRPTGVVNPDAPLGHHIGQDVGHISSTVVGGAIQLAESTLEISTFNGTEPEPTEVDLPMGSLNSYAVRFIQQFTPRFYAMASTAYVKKPEPDEPNLDHLRRFSASIYNNSTLNSWNFNNALIWGAVTDYDDTSKLQSFAEEFVFNKGVHAIWGRIEVLQRSLSELSIAGSSEPDDGKWITAVTIGYTQKISTWNNIDLSLGGSITTYQLPNEFEAAYGGDPMAGKIFLRTSGMKMWNF